MSEYLYTYCSDRCTAAAKHTNDKHSPSRKILQIPAVFSLLDLIILLKHPYSEESSLLLKSLTDALRADFLIFSPLP
jgi:hypothetical protein